MTNSNLLELAKQGEPNAIARLINRSTQSKGITAKAVLKSGCLQLMLESSEGPDKQVWSTFIRTGLIDLEAQSIERVKIYGRRTGEKSPAWVTEFEIITQVDPFLLSVQTLEQFPFIAQSENQQITSTKHLAEPKEDKTELLSNFIRVFAGLFIFISISSIIAMVTLGLLVDSSYFFSFGSIMFFLVISLSMALALAVLDTFKEYIPNQSSFQSHQG